MAAFDLDDFIKQSSIEKLTNCRKDDLFVIAQHYEIFVSRKLLKKDAKAGLLAGLIEKGVLSDAEVVEQGKPPVTAIESPVGPVTPLDAREVRSSLSMPKFEPLSLSTDISLTSQVEARLKVRLARLQLDAQDKAQARRAELLHQLEKYRIETDTRIRLRQLELQVKSEETGLEKRLYVDPNINVNSVAISTDSGNNPVSASMSVLSDSPSAVPFNWCQSIIDNVFE